MLHTSRLNADEMVCQVNAVLHSLDLMLFVVPLQQFGLLTRYRVAKKCVCCDSWPPRAIDTSEGLQERLLNMHINILYV